MFDYVATGDCSRDNQTGRDLATRVLPTLTDCPTLLGGLARQLAADGHQAVAAGFWLVIGQAAGASASV